MRICKKTIGTKKPHLGLSKKHLSRGILFDQIDALYKNRSFEKKFYNDFDYDLFETDIKPTREEFKQSMSQKRKVKTANAKYTSYRLC